MKHIKRHFSWSIRSASDKKNAQQTAPVSLTSRDRESTRSRKQNTVTGSHVTHRPDPSQSHPDCDQDHDRSRLERIRQRYLG